MKRQHEIEQEQREGPPAPPSLHPHDTELEASGPVAPVSPHSPQRTHHPRGNRWVVIGTVILALALIASLGSLLIPGLLHHPAAPAPPAATPPAATTPMTPVPTTPGKTVTPAPAATPTTVPMPPTQTSCPPAGRARAAVMAPLVLGRHANVVYMQDQWEGTNPDPTAGILKRYDTTSRRETVIATGPAIYEAQVSADGQWVLFSSTISHRSSAIQLVRMDGQGLQTLYCSTRGEPVWSLEWSPDQKYLAFKEGLQNVYLLTVATGASRLEVPASNSTWYVPRTWLDNTHLYLTPYRAIGPPPLDVSLLDINTGKVQRVLASPTLDGDFDSSLDGRHLFSSEYVFGYDGTKGPSSIRVQPATGGSATTIYSTPTYAITSLRVVSRTSILFVIHNTGNANVDSSHNGLWKINTDGTGLTRLTSETAGEETTFNRYTQYVWSTVSRDGKSYAVQMSKETSSSSRTNVLLIGSMNGGSPVAIATQPYADQVPLVGWTSM